MAYAVPTNAAVTFFWSTNNWITAPYSNAASVVLTDTGRVSATWSNAMDFGSARYQYFIGVQTTSGLAYRAQGQITMAASPGWLPSPTTWPVWDGWTNGYIYCTRAELLSVSSGVPVVASGVIASWALTGTVAYATDLTARAQASAASHWARQPPPSSRASRLATTIPST